MFKKVQQLYPLSQYLPFRFSNGNLIRQFSKPCLRCHKMLNSQHMHGLIRAVDNYAALAATARCPGCQLTFNIACIITNTKEVKGIWLPARFFRWYLQILPFSTRMPQPIIHPKPDITATWTESPSIQNTVGSEPHPILQFERSEESVGQYNNKPIPAYIIVGQEMIPFSHITTTGLKKDHTEYLIDNYLIYKKHLS